MEGQQDDALATHNQSQLPMFDLQSSWLIKMWTCPAGSSAKLELAVRWPVDYSPFLPSSPIWKSYSSTPSSPVFTNTLCWGWRWLCYQLANKPGKKVQFSVQNLHPKGPINDDWIEMSTRNWSRWILRWDRNMDKMSWWQGTAY
jgi:hypothetical protein